MKKLSSKEAARLARNYPLNVRWSDEDQAFIGSIPGLVGECCHGDTPENVVTQLRDIAEDIVTHLHAKGEPLPSPRLPLGNHEVSTSNHYRHLQNPSRRGAR